MIRIEINSWNKAWKEMTDDDYEYCRSLFPQMSEKRPSSDGYYDSIEAIISDEDLNDLMRRIPFENVSVKPFKGNAFFTQRRDFNRRLRELEANAYLQKESDGVVQIHVPNFWLCSVNEVAVLSDICTDQLQKELDEGWRILCVCPPLDERRPTYVVGRVSHVPAGRAERKSGAAGRGCG